MDDTTRQAAAERRLVDLAKRRAAAYGAVDEVMSEVVEAIGDADEAGISAYRMAQLLGMNEGHVGTLRSAARRARS